ncbi:MAG: hypothetical protein CME88_14420 [Hirschia sp.]|nr:hypothetical protein [Hirschia sp.]MBF19568.1 hypothetical protein [Hirschia sp.]|tara:strand:- start:1954 stop:2799 length:846 start_codon:yes stop_codon:yes gene_type:complete
MQTIYPIRGAFWKQDRMGRILNAAVQRAELDLAWSCLAERACDLAIERFADTIHSVYLCGPAARNRPGGASFAIVLRPAADENGADSWAQAAAAELRREAPHNQSANVTVLGWRDLFMQRGRHSPARFRLSVNSICVGGRNLKPMIPAPKLTEAVANTSIVALETRLLRAKAKTMTANTRRRVRAISAQVGHDVISAGYATIMAGEQLYSEDLDMRRDLFALHYPELKNEIQRAYDMAALPTGDPVPLRTFINDTLKWMTPITSAWLNTYNPQREEVLAQG